MRTDDYSTFGAAGELGVDRSTISRWIKRGWLHATKLHPSSPARIPASEVRRLKRHLLSDRPSHTASVPTPRRRRTAA